MDLAETQVEHWEQLLGEYRSDEELLAYHETRDERRQTVRQEILSLLERYLSGEIDNERFRSEFHHGTSKQWNVFGLKGLSGAMFLNKLVKHLPDQSTLAQQLRTVVRVPDSEAQGREKMSAFRDYVNGLVSSGQVTKQQLQPARSPFLISAWWHLQEPERWPVFYASARKGLQTEGLYSPAQDIVDDYFAFRDSFLSLATTLHVSAWELEHLCAWHEERQVEGKQSVIDTTIDQPPEEPLPLDEPGEAIQSAAEAGSTHVHVQWLLARIGQKFGCQVWIAANDHNRQWNGHKLGEMSLKSLPYLGIGEESQKVIQLIDVLWLMGRNQVVAAFEVEHTTSIYSGLLRMSDLVTLSPNVTFPIYIVSPAERMNQVRQQLQRPTFQYLEMHERCAFFSDESLFSEADHIMKWASGPRAIEKLASKVPDVSSEDATV